MPVDYLSPALAQKMARNGHLSALNTGVLEASTMETPEMASALNASSHGASSAGKKDLEGVLYTSEALDGDVGFPIKYDFAYCESPTPVFVMLPLDVISRDGLLQHVEALRVSLHTLKQIGVEGVMIDVWWGIVEREGPELYDWAAYLELLGMVRDAGLKLNAVMSFHACGANVGDYFKVTLPGWVLRAAEDDPDLFFTDQYGYRNPECISLWADNAMTLQGRTPLECYRDFMASFKKAVVDVNLMDTLSEVSVGCGPCGELRYPAYPENKISPGSSQWQFPGIGEFQCYDQRALGNLARAGSEAGHIEWGGAGPHDAGGYNNLPHETGFFRAHQGSWDSEYGQFSCRGTRASSWDTAIACFDARGPCLAAGQNLEIPRSPSSALGCTGGTTLDRTPLSSPRGTSTHEAAITSRSGTGTSPSSRFAESTARGSTSRARRCETSNTRFSRGAVPRDCFDRFEPPPRDMASRWLARMRCVGSIRTPTTRSSSTVAERVTTRNCGRPARSCPPWRRSPFLRLSKELYEDENFNSFVRFVARMANETGTKVREAPVSPDEVLATPLEQRDAHQRAERHSRRDELGIRRRAILRLVSRTRARDERGDVGTGTGGKGVGWGGKPSKYASTSRRTTQTREDPRGVTPIAIHLIRVNLRESRGTRTARWADPGARGTRTARWADPARARDEDGAVGGPGLARGRGRRGGRTRARARDEDGAVGGPGLANSCRREWVLENAKPKRSGVAVFVLNVHRHSTLRRLFSSRVAPDEESDDGCEERQGRDEGGDRGRVSVCVADAVRRLRLAISRSSASERVSRELRVREPEDEAQERCRGDGRGELASVRRTVGGTGTTSRPGAGDGVETRRETQRLVHRERGKGVIFRFFQMGRHAPVMRRWRREKPRMTPPFLLDRSAALRSAVSPSFLILYRSSSRRNPATSEGMGLDATSTLLLLYICDAEAEGASVLSLPSPSSPSGTGLGGGAGCAYETRSLDSERPSLPLAKSSVKSVEPPLAQLCTRNLSLHPLMSAGHSRWDCMMTWTTCVAPAWTKPVLGLTQYFLGAVVFTLKAISDEPGLYRRIVAGICFLSSTGN